MSDKKPTTAALAGSLDRRRRSTGLWIAFGIVAAVFAYVEANTYALALGAAHHDLFCPEHGQESAQA